MCMTINIGGGRSGIEVSTMNEEYFVCRDSILCLHSRGAMFEELEESPDWKLRQVEREWNEIYHHPFWLRKVGDEIWSVGLELLPLPGYDFPDHLFAISWSKESKKLSLVELFDYDIKHSKRKLDDLITKDLHPEDNFLDLLVVDKILEKKFPLWRKSCLRRS